MGGFLAELRRRHIFRIGGIYVVVAWGVAQVVDLLSQTFALPDWIAQPLLIVLAVGLPITLIAAWVIVGAAQASETSEESQRATSTDWVIAGALIVVIGLIGYQRFFPASTQTVVASAEQDGAETIADEIVQDVGDRLPNSIAVLPFDNLSTDPENAFFAAGIHDTLLNELAKISAMTVISRTSVLRYADGQTPISQIAEELNVETVMEGTVQYAEGRVLVTAQLIDPETEAHLWSENYDREFEGIFAIQADIAMNIANALQAEFSAQEQASIENPSTDSPEAFAQFLEALAEIKTGGGLRGGSRRRTVTQLYLDRAVALDPEFALAHAWKAFIYAYQKMHDPVAEIDWAEHRSEKDRLTSFHAATALQLDSTIGLAHAALAAMHYSNGLTDMAVMEAERALALNPNDTEVLILLSEIRLDAQGEAEDSLRYAQRARVLDPNNAPVFIQWMNALHANGRLVEAEELLLDCSQVNPYRERCTLELIKLEHSQRNIDAALSLLRMNEQLLLSDPDIRVRAELIYIYGLLGESEKAQLAFEEFEQMISEVSLSPGDNPLSSQQYIDPAYRVWAKMGISDYDQAREDFRAAASDVSLVQTPMWIHNIARNTWSDPILEEPEWIGARDMLRPM